MEIFTANPKEENINQDKIEIQRQVQQEYKLIGTINKNKGHILFEYNKITHEVKPAILQEVKTMKINFKAQNTSSISKNKVIINKDCFYLQSLNKANAIKRLRKLGFNI